MSGLFGGGKASVPPPPPVVPIPDINDPAVLARKRRVLEDAATRSGRVSTLLSDNEYSGGKLGIR